MSRVDLHMHSVHSDGGNTPKEILDIAREKGLSTIALTDHDTIMGSKELVRIEHAGIKVYSGVELTVKVPKGRMHILGYNIDLENNALNKRLEEIKEASIYNLLMYIELLKNDFGIVIAKEKIEKLVNAKGNVGRPQLALILIEMGICNSVDEAFEKYLKAVYEKARKCKKGLTKEEAIGLINDAGGVASLAHPGSLLMSNDELFEEIKRLKDMGLGAIEVIHTNSPFDKRVFYQELVDNFGLLETGGSDFHGVDVKPDVEMGSGRNSNVDIDDKKLSLILKVKSRY